MSRLRLKLAIGVAVVGVAATTAAAIAGDRAKLRTSLSGYEEVPAVSTTGGGEFRAAIDRHSDRIQYQITYRAIEGTVTQSHIHFGKPAVNGGISFFLCGTAGFQPPAGTPAPPTCPQSGTVEGDITAAEVIGPTGQGIEVGNLAEILAAMRAGHAYANVHSTKWPGGEIRAQLDDRGHHEGDDT